MGSEAEFFLSFFLLVLFCLFYEKTLNRVSSPHVTDY